MRDRAREREREGDSGPQPPVGPSLGSLWHPCLTTTHPSCRFFVTLPPPPCAVLVVDSFVGPGLPGMTDVGQSPGGSRSDHCFWVAIMEVHMLNP